MYKVAGQSTIRAYKSRIRENCQIQTAQLLVEESRVLPLQLQHGIKVLHVYIEKKRQLLCRLLGSGRAEKGAEKRHSVELVIITY